MARLILLSNDDALGAIGAITKALGEAAPFLDPHEVDVLMHVRSLLREELNEDPLTSHSAEDIRREMIASGEIQT